MYNFIIKIFLSIKKEKKQEGEMKIKRNENKKFLSFLYN